MDKMDFGTFLVGVLGYGLFVLQVVVIGLLWQKR